MQKICLVFICLCLGIYAMAQDATFVVAHRGAKSLAPENTISAFRKAVDLGVKYLECDLCITKDDSLVLMHDLSVDRTTNGTGKVIELTYAQIQTLDAGSKFNSAFTCENVPTLREAILFAKANQVILVPEIKGAVRTQLVVNVINQTHYADSIIVQCFYNAPLRELRAALPNQAILSLTTSASLASLDDCNSISGTGIKYYAPAYATLLSSPSLVEVAKSYNIRLMPWTCNSTTDMLKLMLLGVYGIMTDYPQDMIRLKKNQI